MKMRLRSIGALMICIAIFAVGCAATARPSNELLTLALYVKVGLLVWATFRARYSTGPVAAWWFGFSAVGWGIYAISAFNLLLYQNVGSQPEGNILLTDLSTTTADFICSHLPAGSFFDVPRVAEAVRFWVPVHSEFDRVMHNGVGAQEDIHRWLIIGPSHPSPLSAIPTAQGPPCSS